MTEYNKFQTDADNDININNLRLHYDYQAYENILKNSLTKTLDLLSQKDDINNKLSNPTSKNDIINSNLNPSKLTTNNNTNANNKIKNPYMENTELDNYSLNYIPKTQKHINNLNNNINNNKFMLNYDDEFKKDDYKKSIENKSKLQLQKIRNNSVNLNRKKLISESNKINMLYKQFENDSKQIEDSDDQLYLKNLSNDLFEKENEKLPEYNKMDFTSKYKEGKKFYSTFNNLSDLLIKGNSNTANTEHNKYTNKINEIGDIFLEDKKQDENLNLDDLNVNILNTEERKMKSHKSTPQLNSYLNRDILINNNNYKLNLKEFEIMKNKLYFENNKLEKEMQEIIVKYKELKMKYDIMSKEHFNIKAKYDINKNNVKLLQKKIEEKNYDIDQMKKVLISNNQQITFLNTLKDSNIKMTKDNEDLIQKLKDTISNLNKIIIDNNNKRRWKLLLSCSNVQIF